MPFCIPSFHLAALGVQLELQRVGQTSFSIFKACVEAAIFQCACDSACGRVESRERMRGPTGL